MNGYGANLKKSAILYNKCGILEFFLIIAAKTLSFLIERKPRLAAGPPSYLKKLFI